MSLRRVSKEICWVVGCAVGFCPLAIERAHAADLMLLTQQELDIVTAGATADTWVSLEGSGLPATVKLGTHTYANSTNHGPVSVDVAISVTRGIAIAPSTSGDAGASAEGTTYHYAFSKVFSAPSGRVTMPIAFAIGIDVSHGS